ncbi:hypothetical protein GCM10008023_36200 [Sphingomonas glacialis]|uniref:Uncharacterized protein n=1 Tax=Sphingomonas glacialis TaxID=658225 RepID=A0ABQ3LSP0_9SPHN|nr:hypothetical protein GCM10008023_36200 [Sphingomonas glacialis]
MAGGNGAAAAKPGGAEMSVTTLAAVSARHSAGAARGGRSGSKETGQPPLPGQPSRVGADVGPTARAPCGVPRRTIGRIASQELLREIRQIMTGVAVRPARA